MNDRRGAVIGLLCLAASVSLRLRQWGAGETSLPLDDVPNLLGSTTIVRVLRRARPDSEALLLLQFSSAACQPCLRLDSDLRRIGDSNIFLIKVATDEGRDETDYAFPHTVLRDESRELQRMFSVKVVPTLIIARGDGTVIDVSRGYSPVDGERVARWRTR